MYVIGLTGGIGSGKSTVADLFQALGIDIVDADLVARQVVEPGQPALASIAEHFGPQILDDEGRLRRSHLRDVVFADSTERKWLEDLLHPPIRSALTRQIEVCSSPYCILVSPLLLETSQRELVDRVLVIDVDRDTQINRTLERDAGSRQTIEAIINAQADRDSRLNAADDIIDNSGAVDMLSETVKKLHERYLSLAVTR